MMLRVLVVEDDEKVRESFVRLLTLKGCQVQEAHDGEEAVTCATQEAFDLVFMDVKMPKLDGLSAFHAIRDAAPSTKVVLLTGYNIRGELEQAIQEGTVDCLQKPFMMKDLEELLRRIGAED